MFEKSLLEKSMVEESTPHTKFSWLKPISGSSLTAFIVTMVRSGDRWLVVVQDGGVEESASAALEGISSDFLLYLRRYRALGFRERGRPIDMEAPVTHVRLFRAQRSHAINIPSVRSQRSFWLRHRSQAWRLAGLGL